MGRPPTSNLGELSPSPLSFRPWAQMMVVFQVGSITINYNQKQGNFTSISSATILFCKGMWHANYSNYFSINNILFICVCAYICIPEFLSQDAVPVPDVIDDHLYLFPHLLFQVFQVEVELVNLLPPLVSY